MRFRLATATLLCVAGCGRPGPAVVPETVPPLLVGNFTDDYDSNYSISATEWRHGASTRYRITRWNATERYLIARNDPDNPADGGLWTRIDWIELADMAPYEWAYCYSVYDAPTEAAAEASTVADKANPRTGCNGFPFSRMKPRDDSSQ